MSRNEGVPSGYSDDKPFVVTQVYNEDFYEGTTWRFATLEEAQAYLEKELQKFKDGVRGGDPQDIYAVMMRPMAIALADEQAMKDVVAYIETLSK